MLNFVDQLRKTTLALLAMLLLVSLPLLPVRADLRTPIPPGWYDPDGVVTGDDWHYRVPVNIPGSSSVNSTVKIDVDFNALMTQMGITRTFDVNSIRVVRPNGTLATTQEFTDRIFGNATDAAGNARGEVKFLLEDGGASTYYIYFDIRQNGTKPTNPQTPINGNFERGAAGAISPTQWTGVRTNANFDAQVRPNETVSVTNNGGANETRNTDGSPNTGSFSYLLGSRTNNEPAGGTGTTLTRTIAVPATNPGNLTLRYRVEGWDSSGFDNIRISLIGGATTQIVGPTAGAYATQPFSPNSGGGQQSTAVSGYGPYNDFDRTSTGTHTLGMTTASGDEQWWTRTVSLASFAGQNITLQILSNHATQFKSWYHIDDVEWSIVTPSLGAPEAFGVVITTPTAGDGFAPGGTLTITAQVDANPRRNIRAWVYNSLGTQVAGNIRLFDDGSHGDAVAGDGIYTNDGSVGGQPTYTIPPGTPSSGGWRISVRARDRSNSTIGVQNGNIHRTGQPTPLIEANYWNIDDVLFAVGGADITVTKVSNVVSDPINSTTNPKAIPGAVIRYCILITNNGPALASALTATDTIPANITYAPGTLRSGNSCGAASTVEDDNATGADESDPFGASFSGSTVTGTGNLASGAAFALTFQATVD